MTFILDYYYILVKALIRGIHKEDLILILKGALKLRLQQ